MVASALHTSQLLCHYSLNSTAHQRLTKQLHCVRYYYKSSRDALNHMEDVWAVCNYYVIYVIPQRWGHDCKSFKKQVGVMCESPPILVVRVLRELRQKGMECKASLGYTH